MPYFKTCPECGAHLDPCELCDCKRNAPGPHQRAKAHNERVSLPKSIADWGSDGKLSISTMIYQRSIMEMVHGISDTNQLRMICTIIEGISGKEAAHA